MRVTNSQLHHLSHLYGVKTSYLDMEKRPSQASNSALLAVLKAMGAPLATLEDVPSAIREKQQQYWRRIIEPVIVVWNPDMLAIDLHLTSRSIGTSANATINLENGGIRNLVWRITNSGILDSATIEKNKYYTVRLLLPEPIPIGYHNLKLELPGQTIQSLIISAPLKAYIPPNSQENIWGGFLPLYALKTQNSWGAGDFSDLGRLVNWLAESGGRVAGSLPLLPLFYDEQFGPGPYMPASRLFWNEIYLDIHRVPELRTCQQAQELINSTEYRESIYKLQKSRRVDYYRILSLKRRILEELGEHFFSTDTDRSQAFRKFLKSNRQVEEYARFRAAGESHGIDWTHWPTSMRNGKLKQKDYSEKAARYYLYSQWLAQEQLNEVFNKARQKDSYIYMDVPVGVHPYSYDVWSERESFVAEVSGGAPPDPVFTNGQNWCFPPLHPEIIREQGYRYVINSLRHQLRPGSMLRIDHMMNFHRLFWIPRGLENRDGVYVSYRAPELYAILTLESFRTKSIIIGEDLGIVPPEVRPMMEKHGIYRMFVGQYELIAENQMEKIPSHCVASLNTHDMYPFASFWEEVDITERLKLKLLDEKMAQKELEQRRQLKRILISILQYRGLDNEVSQDTRATLMAVYKLLAGSPDYAFLINIEDLWLEHIPQNVPGTIRKQNWTRKALCSFEQFSQSPIILETLQEVNRIRKGIA